MNFNPPGRELKNNFKQEDFGNYYLKIQLYRSGAMYGLSCNRMFLLLKKVFFNFLMSSADDQF